VRKKTAIVLVGLLAVVLAVAAYFIRKDKQVVIVDPWVAIPSDAFFIIETPDFPELLTSATDRNGITSRLSGMRWAASLVDAAAVIDSITGSREMRELISNREVLLSFHVTGQGRVAILGILSTGTSVSSHRLIQLCERSGAEVTDTRELGGAKLFVVTYGKGNKKITVHIAMTSGIIVVSTSETLVANALNNKSSGSDIRHQQGFAPVVSASGKDSDNIYILFRNLPRFIQSFIVPDDITPVSSVAIAAGGDLTAREDGLFISGFQSTAGAGQGADRLSDVAAEECGVHELLPQGTLSYRTIMKRAKLSGETASDPASINATDLALSLSPFTGNEVTVATISSDEEEEKVMLFRMTDRQAAENMLRERLAAKYRSMGLRETSFITYLNSNVEEGGVIYKMPFTGVASVLSGETAGGDSDSWVLFCRSYMVLSGKSEALVTIKKMSDSDNTLINDPDFREMEKTLPTKSSFLFYSSASALRSLVDPFLTRAASQTLTDRSFAGIDGVGLSLTPSNGMIYTSFSVRYSDRYQQAPQRKVGAAATPGADTLRTADLDLAWRVKLDGEPSVKPFFFMNHNTGATEIFIQDQKNTIYLISASGKILWKAPIREQIKGDIYMIDYYKNGKNQLLFSGKDYLHLIDRNGNYVDKYPVKLRSPASNSLAVFDYESNKEYRLFVAGEDRKIYVYDRAGSPVRGWNLFTTRGVVTNPVVFFRVRGKDYLFVADKQAVYILDRTGNIRIGHQEPLRKAVGSHIRLTGEDQQALIFSAPDGTLIRLYFDGSVKSQSVATFSEGHSSDFIDINADGKTDYIFIDNGMLHVYDNSGSEMYSKAFGSYSLIGPEVFSFSASDRKIAVYDSGKKMIDLTGRSESSATGFPRRAGQYYNIGRVTNKSTWNLLINQNDGYLYNYVINSGYK
jgi:hypothetical protein